MGFSISEMTILFFDQKFQNIFEPIFDSKCHMGLFVVIWEFTGVKLEFPFNVYIVF